MVKTVVSIHRRGPFSAIVQSESMSYSSIVVRCSPTGECRRQLVWCPKASNDREGTDQRDFFIFDRTRLYLFARILNRTLATARPARLPARDATGALPPPWRTACPRPWHPWRRLRRRRRRPLPRQRARQTIFRTLSASQQAPLTCTSTLTCVLRPG